MTQSPDEAAGAPESTSPRADNLELTIERICDAAEHRPASINAHRELFRLHIAMQDGSLGALGDDMASRVIDAADRLPALTLQDCTYKLALWWHAHRDDFREKPPAPDHVAASLLADLVRITGANDALHPERETKG
ncbi:MAG: hypothetical protein AAF830_05290 [Pseudomonadota bacterium]